MNFNKIKENLTTIGAALADSGKEIIAGIKDDLTPMTMEEKLKLAKEEIESNPNLTKEDILEILNKVDKKSPYEETIENLKERVSNGYSKLLSLYEDTPEQAKVVKEKIQKILSAENREDLIEAIKLEENLSRAKEIIESGSKKAIKRVKHILNSFVENID